jgi:hypothetical protein
MEEEKQYVQNFWDLNAPLNPHLSHQESIRNHFVWKKEKIHFQLGGKSLQLEYSLIEPKEEKNTPSKNFIYLPGNIVTHDNYVLGPYPFLSSYLDKREREKDLPPLRLFIISYNSIYGEDGRKYYSKNIDEPGLILAKVLDILMQKEGPIDFISANSSGNVVLASSLKYLSSIDLLPKKIHFDRSLSSIQEASHNFGLLQKIVFFLARFTNWNIDIGQEIFQHLSSRENQTLLISAVKKDHLFSGKASLTLSPHIKALEDRGNAHTLTFDLICQHYHPRVHHMLNTGLLHEYDLINKENTPLQKGETMADCIIRLLYQND